MEVALTSPATTPGFAVQVFRTTASGPEAESTVIVAEQQFTDRLMTGFKITVAPGLRNPDGLVLGDVFSEAKDASDVTVDFAIRAGDSLPARTSVRAGSRRRLRGQLIPQPVYGISTWTR